MRLDLLVNDFVYSAVTDRFLVIFENDFKRNYVHIEDVADAFCLDHFDEMKGEPYNVGLNEANLSKAELAEEIKKQIPALYIHYAEVRPDPDKRNYIVSNEKIRKKGFTSGVFHRTINPICDRWPIKHPKDSINSWTAESGGDNMRLMGVFRFWGSLQADYRTNMHEGPAVTVGTAIHKLERFLYRHYRHIKAHFLQGPLSAPGKLFFWVLYGVQQSMSRRRILRRSYSQEERWKKTYDGRWGDSARFVVKTDRRIALDSDDHKNPRGAMYDSSVNRRFNEKLYRYFNHRSDLRVVDLGCAGGGFVRTILEDGFLGVGLEGSDVPKRRRLGEWPALPHHLFTCDISQPFRITDQQGNPVQFHCITAWEVLEHIPEANLPVLMKNIRDHLAPDGIFVGSIDSAPDGDPITGAVYHVTLHDRPWWLHQFAKAGLQEGSEHPFEVQDFVRGNGVGLMDWDPADGEGFHVVMGRSDAHGRI